MAAVCLQRTRGRQKAALAGVIALALTLLACGGKNNASSNDGSGQPPAANAVRVVAAENFYGDIAHQLGGIHVSVTSILSDPNADPHEYESSSDNAKAIAGAQLVIENGVGYDAFMDRLLAASPNTDRVVVTAGTLLGRKQGDNPHVWYNVDWMAQVADRITAALLQLDPTDQAEFATRNQQFRSSLQPLSDRISRFKARYGGTHLTQTEPVFGYMGDALGLVIDDGEYQHAIEEGTDPSPRAVAEINREITDHQVKALLYNSQTATPATTKLKSLAEEKKVPIVGVSETEPKGKTYQQWMLSQLDQLQTALGG